MKTLKFDGYETEVTEEDLQQESLEVDFGGCLMVLFHKQDNGTFKPVNAMDGWGENCFEQIKDLPLEIV